MKLISDWAHWEEFNKRRKKQLSLFHLVLGVVVVPLIAVMLLIILIVAGIHELMSGV